MSGSIYDIPVTFLILDTDLVPHNKALVKTTFSFLASQDGLARNEAEDLF